MLTVKQAATRIGVSVSLVYLWVESRQLAHYRISATGKRGHIRIAETDLDAFLASMKCGQAKDAAKPPARRRPIKLEHLQMPC
jgi:excisionase family DNA binding protein